MACTTSIIGSLVKARAQAERVVLLRISRVAEPRGEREIPYSAIKQNCSAGRSILLERI
jgi:hypothetical protein